MPIYGYEKILSEIKVNTTVQHYKFPGNGIVKRVDTETYSIPMATVLFPLLGNGEKVYRPLNEFQKI